MRQKRDPLSACLGRGIVKWYFPSGKQSGNMSKKRPHRKKKNPKYRKLYLGKDAQCPNLGAGSVHQHRVLLRMQEVPTVSAGSPPEQSRGA